MFLSLIPVFIYGLVLLIPGLFLNSYSTTRIRQIGWEFTIVVLLVSTMITVSNAAPLVIYHNNTFDWRILGGIWLGGTVISLGWILFTTLVQWLRLRRQLAPSMYLDEIEVRASRMGLRHIRVVSSEHISSVAAVFGRTIIVNQKVFATIQPDQRQLIIDHEIAHLKSSHWFRTFAVSMVVSLIWWHPLLVLAKIELLTEREIEADSVASESGKVRYVETLIQLLSTKSATSLTGFSRVSKRRRWRALCNSPKPKGTVQFALLHIVGILSLFIFLPTTISTQLDQGQPISKTIKIADAPKDSDTRIKLSFSLPSSSQKLSIGRR